MKRRLDLEAEKYAAKLLDEGGSVQITITLKFHCNGEEAVKITSDLHDEIFDLIGKSYIKKDEVFKVEMNSGVI